MVAIRSFVLVLWMQRQCATGKQVNKYSCSNCSSELATINECCFAYMRSFAPSIDTSNIFIESFLSLIFFLISSHVCLKSYPFCGSHA